MAPPRRTTKAAKSSSLGGVWRRAVGSLKGTLGERSPLGWALHLLTEPGATGLLTAPLLLLEVAVCALVIWRVPYTEIDWRAYMQEVEGFLNGTRDYRLLQGDTGPLVYPAGFVYVYSALYYLTGGGQRILLAQWVFAGIYLANTGVVLLVYRRLRRVPPYLLVFMCCLSYRVHSIHLLRLFNDPVAMLVFHCALLCFLHDRWSAGCVLYSLAVSVKMNVLLYAPGLLLLLLMRHHVWEVAGQLSVCALVQLLVGAPFLAHSTSAYLGRAFEFSRQFLFKWTVNWRFLPEAAFHSRLFHAGLLGAHLLLLLIFLLAYARSRRLSLARLVRFGTAERRAALPAEDVACVLFVSNFIGIACARSLHYQFYVWYFHSLHYLVWRCGLPPVAQLLLLGCIELSWNTYPSTCFSSGLLHCCHLVMLAMLLRRVVRPALPADAGGRGTKAAATVKAD